MDFEIDSVDFIETSSDGKELVVTLKNGMEYRFPCSVAVVFIKGFIMVG